MLHNGSAERREVKGEREAWVNVSGTEKITAGELVAPCDGRRFAGVLFTFQFSLFTSPSHTLTS